MYKISQLAGMFDLSRSTLLYYDRIGLLRASENSLAGYRIYTEEDCKRLETICLYRSAGLSLEEIKVILESPDDPDRELLEKRLEMIDQQIQELRGRQRLLAGMLKVQATGIQHLGISKEVWVQMLRDAGMDDQSMRKWHEQFEQRAPEEHHRFLLSLGISEKEALKIRSAQSEKEENVKE